MDTEEKRQARWTEVRPHLISARIPYTDTLASFERCMGPLEAFTFQRLEIDGMLTFDFERGVQRMRTTRA